MKQINREILSIAVPSIVTNITTPLLALMDVVIVGHMGGADYIAAIAVGGTIFNMIYWLFAFLRMGSSGLTAQAYGAGNRSECFRTDDCLPNTDIPSRRFPFRDQGQHSGDGQ